jgi:hypothetical protein
MSPSGGQWAVLVFFKINSTNIVLLALQVFL